MMAKEDCTSEDENNTIDKRPRSPTSLFYYRIETDDSKAVDIMSLVPPIPTEEGIWKPVRVEMDGEGRKKFYYGEPLVEIYSVRIGDLGGRKCGKIYGKLVLGCRYRYISLLNIDQENALTIECQDSLPLNGPDVAPLENEPFVITADLKEDGEEFCREVIYWNDGYFDTWFNETVIGNRGTLNVIYTVFEHALLAEVHLQLTKLMNRESTVRIEGSITVYFDDMQYLRTVVLNKSRDECFTVRLSEDIPLSRSLFCCHRGSSIVVKIDLWDSKNSEPLVQGSLLFPAMYYGNTEGTLSGQHGEMQVKIAWMYYADHPKTSNISLHPEDYEEEVTLFD